MGFWLREVPNSNFTKEHLKLGLGEVPHYFFTEQHLGVGLLGRPNSNFTKETFRERLRNIMINCYHMEDYT